MDATVLTLVTTVRKGGKQDRLPSGPNTLAFLFGRCELHVASTVLLCYFCNNTGRVCKHRVIPLEFEEDGVLFGQRPFHGAQVVYSRDGKVIEEFDFVCQWLVFFPM